MKNKKLEFEHIEFEKRLIKKQVIHQIIRTIIEKKLFIVIERIEEC